MNKKKIRKIIVLSIIIILSILLIISLIHILIWHKDNKETDKEVKKIEENTKVVEVEDNENTEIIKQEVDEFNPYWDYIGMSLINVDFTDLVKQNSDTVAWIKVNGTNINYPVVRGSDNSFYLTHSFNKKKNSAGWVFMDTRNNPESFDRNTIIYAHGRLNGTMFGSLKNSLTNGWLDNPDNYVVKLSTPYENTLWQVFSVYHIPNTSDYIKIEFLNDDKFNTFVNMLKDRSAHDFNTDVSGSDKILTLSTCFNENEKVVLHAKLIKKEAR